MNTLASTKYQGGFTLVELMIAVAILAIISAIALPLYNGYVQTSREATLTTNMSTIEVFQEDYRLRTGSFMTTAANTAAITALIDWDPQDGGTVAYVITDPGDGGYRVTGTDATGFSYCLEFPEKEKC